MGRALQSGNHTSQTLALRTKNWSQLRQENPLRSEEQYRELGFCILLSSVSNLCFCFANVFPLLLFSGSKPILFCWCHICAEWHMVLILLVGALSIFPTGFFQLLKTTVALRTGVILCLILNDFHTTLCQCQNSHRCVTQRVSLKLKDGL